MKIGADCALDGDKVAKKFENGVHTNKGSESIGNEQKNNRVHYIHIKLESLCRDCI